MSKINQIQNALEEIEGGVFQKLCDSYLKSMGFGAINSLGSVIGTNKTRIGTPDSYARQDNGQLVFAEYTTKKSSVIDKFIDDFKKCTDKKKTGIPVAEINKIVFCHTSKLTVEEENRLVKIAKKKGIVAHVFGLEAISFDLYVQYPGLAKDFLGVVIDTGQILPPQSFVDNYDKNKLATPLGTKFLHREDDLKQGLKHLDTNNLLIISGSAGVGKSRLALEIVDQYQKLNPNYKAFCFANKGQDLFEDIRVYFSNAGQFIILVDDANRTTGFEYIIDLLQRIRDDQNIKVIATVRDYALEKVRDSASEIGLVPEMAVKPFEDKELQSLISQLFGINNSLWLERITQLSAGNPRLAVMAASFAKEQDDLNSINDVSALYHLYFKSIRQDIQKLGGSNAIEVAGIISFFRIVDKSNEKLMQRIGEVFKISEVDFWAACSLLHEFELVDIYENEVVKISDQVISTYLFYLCFLEENSLPIEKLFEAFLPEYPNKVRDALYPCLNSFNTKSISDRVAGVAKKQLEKCKADGATHKINKIFEVFWFVLQIELLNYIKIQIGKTEQENIELNSIVWDKPNTNVPKNNLIDQIKLFANANDQDFETAIQLIFLLAEKQPSSVPDIIYILTDSFGFHRRSHLMEYDRQVKLMDLLISKTEMGSNELFSRLFLAVSVHLLEAEHDETVGDKNGIVIHRFSLLLNETIKKYRKKIWQTIFELSKVKILTDAAFEIIDGSRYNVRQLDIQQFDASIILPLIREGLSPERFQHALIIVNWLNSMSHLKLSGVEVLIKSCDSRTMDLYKLLKFDLTDIESDQYLNFEQIKLSKISDYSNSFSFENYMDLLDQYSDILNVVGGRDDQKFKSGLEYFFSALANRDEKLFVDVVTKLLHENSVFENSVRPYEIVQNLFKSCSLKKVEEIISGSTSDNRWLWELAFHETIPENLCTEEHVNKYYALAGNSKCRYPVHRWDCFQKYAAIDKNFFVSLTEIISERIKEGGYKTDEYGLLFNPHTELCKNLASTFSKDSIVLKEAYLTYNKVRNLADHDGFVMNQILDIDRKFLQEYFKFILKDKQYFNRHNDKRRYDFLWTRIDFEEIVDSLIESLIKLSVDNDIHYYDVMSCVFTVDDRRKPKEKVIGVQDKYLETRILNESKNSKKMELLFAAISHFENERKIGHVATLLSSNSDFELFKRIRLEPHTGGWSGSAVPFYSKKRDFWQSISSLCNTIDLLDHRARCQENIQMYNKEIEHEKKRDFIGWE